MQKLYLAFGLCVALVACGSDDNTKRGGAGESCTSRNDCNDGLVCSNNVCTTSMTQQPIDGGPSTPVTPGPVLSGPGESCTKTADCVTGYKCFDGTCLLSAPPVTQPDAAIIYVTVDAGPTAPVNPVLSGRGETCTQSSDCEQGLICLAISATTNLGVCDKATYGFQTGTNTCYAECKTDLDCCEIPLGTTGVSGDGVTVEYNSCADLLKAMTPYNGSNCGDQATISHECFLYKTYCNCATSNPWKCSAQKRCSYGGTCDATVVGELMKGCPVQTRAGFPVPPCNATTLLCASVAAVGGCTTDDECTGSGVADYPGEICAPGECKCLAASGTCYRKCNNELDCAPGYTCDTTQQLCKPAGECTTDVFCALKLGNVGAKCAAVAGSTAKTCRLPCATDQDCSPSGLTAAAVFTGSVCGADKFCGSLGCSSDAECSLEIPGASGSVLGSVKMFCAAPVTTTSVQWVSAITD